MSREGSGVFRFSRRWLYRAQCATLEARIARGHALVEESKAQVHADAAKLSRAYSQLRKVRMRLAMIEPARALIEDVLRGNG